MLSRSANDARNISWNKHPVNNIWLRRHDGRGRDFVDGKFTVCVLNAKSQSQVCTMSNILISDVQSSSISIRRLFKWTNYILKQFNDAGRVMWLLTECEQSKLQMMFIFFQERYIHKDW